MLIQSNWLLSLHQMAITNFCGCHLVWKMHQPTLVVSCTLFAATSSSCKSTWMTWLYTQMRLSNISNIYTSCSIVSKRPAWVSTRRNASFSLHELRFWGTSYLSTRWQWIRRRSSRSSHVFHRGTWKKCNSSWALRATIGASSRISLKSPSHCLVC